MNLNRPVALIILDGWGIREREKNNAVALAQTPNFDYWLKNYERSIVDASGKAVGLPAGQMGNSEVGHLNLGAGRVVYQDITRIDKAIADGDFDKIQLLVEALTKVKAKQGNLHLVGLLGEGGVHSHSRHLFALIRLAAARGLNPIIHVITDGRDTPPQSGIGFLQELEEVLAEVNALRLRTSGSRSGTSAIIASVSGRYYAMDRDNRWLRTQCAYEAIVHHEALMVPSAKQAVAQAYMRGVTDEFIEPVVVELEQDVSMQTGDCVICFNFRADRMRQFVNALGMPAFSGFERPYVPDLKILTMTSYQEGLPVEVIFPDEPVEMPLAAVLSEAGLTQIHAAETEKYPHVTYFFNGGQEEAFTGETRIMVASPKVITYDLQPEMSAYELTQKLEIRLLKEDDDFILVNFANPDMVGHTGDLAAAIKAVEVVDECAGILVDKIGAKGGTAIVTADHGNCEIMVDERTGDPHTYHTTQPVNLFVIGEGYCWLRPRGILADVAPTILQLLGVKQPVVMTGRSLLEE